MTNLLHTSDDIKAVLRDAAQADTLYLDTEFHWRQSYFPQACVFQIKFGNESHLIELLNFDCKEEMATLMQCPATKIFHSPSQDLWVLKLLCGAKLTNVLDTQVGAAFLGSPAQVSLAGLMQKFCDKTISKGQQVSNWKKRPLTDAQLTYALNDVIFLEELYVAMREKIEEAGRIDWFEEECHNLFGGKSNNEKNRSGNTLYRKVKGWKALQRYHLTILAELCQLRESVAAEIDLTPRLVVDDETMLNIARELPGDTMHLSKCGFNAKFMDRLGEDFVNTCLEMKNLPQNKWIHSNSGGRLSDVEEALQSRLGKACNIASNRLNIESPFIFNRGSLQKFASNWYKDESRPELSGWRAENLQEPFDKIFNSL